MTVATLTAAGVATLIAIVGIRTATADTLIATVDIPIVSVTMTVAAEIMTVVAETMTVVAEIMTVIAIMIAEIMIVAIEITNTTATKHATEARAIAEESSPRLWSIHVAASTTNPTIMSDDVR